MAGVTYCLRPSRLNGDIPITFIRKIGDYVDIPGNHSKGMPHRVYAQKQVDSIVYLRNEIKYLKKSERDARKLAGTFQELAATYKLAVVSLQESKTYLLLELLTLKNIVTVRGLFEHLEERLCPPGMKFNTREQKWTQILSNHSDLRKSLFSKAGWTFVKQVEGVLVIYGMLCEFLHEGKHVFVEGGEVHIYVEPLIMEQATAVVCIGEEVGYKIKPKRIKGDVKTEQMTSSE